MDELLTQIQEIQKHLYGGYKAEGETNVDWLEVRPLKLENLRKYFSNSNFLATFFKVHQSLQ